MTRVQNKIRLFYQIQAKPCYLPEKPSSYMRRIILEKLLQAKQDAILTLLHFSTNTAIIQSLWTYDKCTTKINGTVQCAEWTKIALKMFQVILKLNRKLKPGDSQAWLCLYVAKSARQQLKKKYKTHYTTVSPFNQNWNIKMTSSGFIGGLWQYSVLKCQAHAIFLFQSLC